MAKGHKFLDKRAFRHAYRCEIRMAIEGGRERPWLGRILVQFNAWEIPKQVHDAVFSGQAGTTGVRHERWPLYPRPDLPAVGSRTLGPRSRTKSSDDPGPLCDDEHRAQAGQRRSRGTRKQMDSFPVMGNGNLMVTLSGMPDCLTFHLGKTDFWRDKCVDRSFRQSGNVLAGYLNLMMPEMAKTAISPVRGFSSGRGDDDVDQGAGGDLGPIAGAARIGQHPGQFC